MRNAVIPGGSGERLAAKLLEIVVQTCAQGGVQTGEEPEKLL
jgi:hypothetical protein